MEQVFSMKQDGQQAFVLLPKSELDAIANLLSELKALVMGKAKEEAQATIDGLTKQVEELSAGLDITKMDEAGLKELFGKVMKNPMTLLKLSNILKELGYEVAPIQKTE